MSTKKEETMWVNTHRALAELYETLTCKRCSQRLQNPKQFLNCGHFACAECIGSETTCFECKIPGESTNVYSDKTIQDLLFNLSLIADAVGYKLPEKANDSASETKSVKTDQEDKKSSRSSSKKLSLKRSTKTKIINETLNTSICDSVVSKSTFIGIPKNLNKKNSKGETKLHLACKHNHIERVKELLEAGADPNTKDHAGWTPLQEAASYAHLEVCELLLKAGAKPDMYGCDNRTALHEAVIADEIDLVSKLLNFNANKDVFDNVGKKPRDYCKSKEIKELLESSCKIATDEQNKSSDLDKSIATSSKIVLYGSNLKLKKKKLLIKLGVDKKLKVVNNFSSIVTHVFVETDDASSNIQLSLDVLLTILHGKWLLNSDGLNVLLDSPDTTVHDLSLFELNPPRLDDTLIRSRENSENQHPKLFNNCFFYFAVKNHETIHYDGLSLKKENLTKLASAGDGITLTREPKPDDIQGSLSPFHVANNPNHSLHKCTHYVIYIPEERYQHSNRIIYNLPYLKTLPLMWFIESILSFRLIDPADLGLLAD